MISSEIKPNRAFAWRVAGVAIVTVALAAPGFAQQGNSLEGVLHSMDQAAANFRAAQANFVWTLYNSVVNDTEKDSGKIYFRRSGNETEMAADVTTPAAKQIIFSKGKIQVYTEATGQVDVYNASAHREEFEAFLVLGFGSSSSEMKKSFDVKYAGQEKIGDVETAKLELTPLSEKIKNQFPKIDLWVDPQRGFSLREQLWQADGDYRLADYSDIQTPKKIANNVFELRTSGNTHVVNH